ncbi:MAG TPA: chorismate-binding protein [Salinimicrobium sp.]|nr:chorismate-binding protein [Salinimicrobium sp.]
MIAPEDFFLKLENQFKQDLPFVAYKDPKEDNLLKAFLQFDPKRHIVEDFTESGFVFAPFNSQNPTYYIPSDFPLTTEFIPSDELEVNSQVAPALGIANKIEHIELVKKGIAAIKAHNFQKVVLSRKETISIKNQDAFSIFKKLLRKYPTAFVYVFYHPNIGLWLGATPEILLSVQRNKLSTMALAGTQKNNDKKHVLWGEKEKEEQEIVTFSILKNLKDSGITKIKASDVYTSTAGNLLHLKTDIEAELDATVPIGKIILALHPTPAVCGLPKESAKSFILKNEGYEREYYSGFLGALNINTETKRNPNKRNQENRAYSSVVKKTSLFVNLRCMKLTSEKAVVFIGGGITKDSDPEAEWEETVNKAETMKAVL